MNCETATELIEAFAEGEIEHASELAAHVDVCPRCAAQLVIARQVNQWLTSGGASPPRHLTASVLQRLPSRMPDVRDGLEARFNTIAALSLLPVIVGIWFLADPAFLRQVIDTSRAIAYGVSSLLFNPSTTLTTYLAIVVVGVTAILSLGLLEEA